MEDYLVPLTTFLGGRASVFYLNNPGEPLCKEQFDLWRMEWKREVRALANQRMEIPENVARSYIHAVGPEGLRDLRAASNVETWRINAVYAPVME